MVIGAETRTHSAPQISKIWDADPLAVLLVVVGGSGVRAVVAQGRNDAQHLGAELLLLTGAAEMPAAAEDFDDSKPSVSGVSVMLSSSFA